MADLISVPTIPWQTIDSTNKMDRVQNFKTDSQLKEAGSELESLFIYYLFKEMRATIPKSGFISGGKAEAIYTSMLDFQMAKELSFKGGIGLSSLFFDQLSRKTAPIEPKNAEKTD